MLLLTQSRACAWEEEDSFILEENAEREVEQPLLLPVFLVLRYLSFQQGLQVSAHGAVEGGKIHSPEVSADTEVQRVYIVNNCKSLHSD